MHGTKNGHGYVQLLLGSVIFHQAGDTPFQNKIYLKHKIWLGKIWQIYGHLANVSPAKVSLHTVFVTLIVRKLVVTKLVDYGLLRRLKTWMALQLFLKVSQRLLYVSYIIVTIV